MNIGEKIRLLRIQNDLTQEELANAVGTKKQTIHKYETGIISNIPASKVKLLADKLNSTPAFLMGWDNPVDDIIRFPSPSITETYTSFPVIGDIAAGYNHIATESWEGDTVEIPDSYLFGHKKEDFFVLRVVGDSMYPLYHENDKVLILKQSTLNMSGEIGAVLYDDEIVTLKKVEYVIGEDWLRLIPINPNYKPETIEGERLEHCKIIGIPRLLLREV